MEEVGAYHQHCSDSERFRKSYGLVLELAADSGFRMARPFDWSIDDWDGSDSGCMTLDMMDCGLPADFDRCKNLIVKSDFEAEY